MLAIHAFLQKKKDLFISVQIISRLKRTVSIFQVQSPGGGRLSLCGGDLELIDVTDLLDDLSSLFLEEGRDLVENSLDFHGHYVTI